LGDVFNVVGGVGGGEKEKGRKAKLYSEKKASTKKTAVGSLLSVAALIKIVRRVKSTSGRNVNALKRLG